MGLRDYAKKRNFQKTAEPRGSRARKTHSELHFVIQKHAARRLHYDFRLELDGTLKSWAVPKGPSLDPEQKRLAVQVEDHPVEYQTFEGTIPQGEYGGGSVMLWDRGTWRPLNSPREGLRKGSLIFDLEGERLHGRWHLVRTKDEKNWLLIKGKDQFASKGKDKTFLEKENRSVASLRTMEQIAHGEGTARAELTNPTKILYPDVKITKQDLADYYEKVADRMLPLIKDRPLMLLRCADGRGKSCFIQKKWTKGLPDSFEKIPNPLGDPDPMITVRSREGIIDFAQIAALEVHIWGSRTTALETPDLLVFDLDPDPAVEWKKVVDTAFLLRDRLKTMDLKSFVKTSGGKGLHVEVPLAPRLSWDQVKQFARAFSEDLVNRNPELLIATMTKKKRTNKIFIDYFRNARGSTAIAPYSPRAREGAAIAMPISWQDLRKGIHPDTFRLREILNGKQKIPRNPWTGIDSLLQLPRRP
jgi:bifunctional non-homologous end joining protein LigD